MAERDAALAERDCYRRLFHSELIKNAATNAITTFGGRAKILATLVAAQLEVREVGEHFRVIVVDEATRQERQGFLLEDLISEMGRADLVPAFDGASMANTGKKLVRNPWSNEHEDLAEQARLLLRNPILAERLRREAGRA